MIQPCPPQEAFLDRASSCIEGGDRDLRLLGEPEDVAKRRLAHHPPGQPRDLSCRPNPSVGRARCHDGRLGIVV